MSYIKKYSLFTLALLIFSANIWGAQGDVTIEADKASFNQKTGHTTYSGNVIITQDTILFLAEKVEVILKNKKISQAIATGSPAKLTRAADDKTPELDAYADKIIYQITQETLELLGNASLKQGEHVLQSGRIIYRINEQRIDAQRQGGQRVKITLPADSNALN